MKINIKNINIKSICAILFISLFFSCNNSGPELREGQAAMADGRVIDLTKVSKKIRDAIDFAAGVKEVNTLVKSIDELAKAIGSKIKNSDTLDTSNNNHNGSLIAGAFQVVLAIEFKLKELEKATETPDSIKAKVISAKDASRAFIEQIKKQHTNLGQEGATDVHAKSAILLTDGTKDQGVAELVKLNSAMAELLAATKKELETVMMELKEPSRTTSTQND
ncbi:vsp protein (plasmid) [Borrelia coriaceae]|uniref:Vsp/OspC family lipoprotein n=1 Tax=Borrelia coriaceae TaxID=144 RepID=UPI00047F3F6A|nr:Vsp/OspC family lipoprotein [Borrelia coriaceae]UPA17121.1 vsp protein [Borrelia coriaceae]